MAEGKPVEWTVGLRNYATGKYLTQEAFGLALNVNGPSLKKKQIFTLVPGSAAGTVNVRTHLGKFLYGLVDGTFKGDADAPNADTDFTIVPAADGTIGLVSRHGFYAHGVEENLRCFTKEQPADGKWVVVLAMHPQINILNANRKRWVHLVGNELQCNEDVPWGEDALITLVFFEEIKEGRYGFMSSNGKFLQNSGKLVDKADKSCQFLLGFHDNQVSLRDETGKYLSCVGANGVLQVNKDKVTKDELFMISDSEPQFTIQDNRGRFTSIRSGNLKADQADVTDLERFQMEIDAAGKVSFKTSKAKYWLLGGDGNIEATAPNKDAAGTKFGVEYHGKVCKLIGNNGKYVIVKSNGGYAATGNGGEAEATFTMKIINRPELVLRGQFGFVGLKGPSGRVECNRASADVFVLKCEGGDYSISKDGKFWTVDADGVAATSAKPVTFHLEFVARSKFLIKHAESGKYIEGEQNGGFRAIGGSANINTLWEY